MAAERDHADDLRGASRLVVEATRGVTTAVEQMHRAIADGPAGVARPLTLPGRLVAGIVYGSVRGVTSLVGAGLERGLVQLGPLLGASAPGPEREAVVAAINGVVGDWLAATDNPLAIPSRLRRGGVPLVLEPAALAAAVPARAKVVVLVHGSSMSDVQWRRRGHDHGVALEADGFAAVYAHYNSGRHVSQSGAELAALLEALVAAWPVPLTELALIGHSMGGLVARSACHYGAEAGHRWPAQLRRIVFLGTPHHGAPLERAGHWVDVLLGSTLYSRPFARLGQLRSAGITDLRYGHVLDADWQGRDRFRRSPDRRTPVPLPAGVECFTVAATLAARRCPLAERLLGDGLVPLHSALGMHDDPARGLAFARTRRYVVHQAGHMDLLSHAGVARQLTQWLAE